MNKEPLVYESDFCFNDSGETRLWIILVIGSMANAILYLPFVFIIHTNKFFERSYSDVGANTRQNQSSEKRKMGLI